MNKLKIFAITTLSALSIFVFTSGVVLAQEQGTDGTLEQAAEQGIAAAGDSAGGPSVESILKTIVTTLSFIVGAISVIMIVIGGLRYVLSAGDSNAVNGAKNTILYAVIGLVVAFSAFAIVNFVLNAL